MIQVQLRVSNALSDISHQLPRLVHVCRGMTITLSLRSRNFYINSDCVYIACDYSIPGTFARELRSTTCAQCTSGKSSPSGSSSCIDCQAGKFKYAVKQFYQLLMHAHFTCILCCDRFVKIQSGWRLFIVQSLCRRSEFKTGFILLQRVCWYVLINETLRPT